MRAIVVSVLCLGFASAAAGLDFGNHAPVKAPATYALTVPAPGRQGGDTIETATVIPALPYVDMGSTIGYHDDYEEICPAWAIAPDVVYRYTAVGTVAVDIDLCGSNYDTKVFVYDDQMHLIACNDDFYFGPPCGMYVSKLENVTFAAGMSYDIIVDGYGEASGYYILNVSEYVPCILDCPAGGYAEGEPQLVDDYVDNWNGGCNTDPENPFQSINGNSAGEAILCGVSGWFLFDGDQRRDTDWFLLTMGQGGSIEVTADAEFASDVFELGPQDCDAVGVVQHVIAGDCAEASMTISGYAPGAPVWFWLGPTTFVAPPGGDDEYDYVVWFTGLEAGVATEATTWSTLKALYD